MLLPFELGDVWNEEVSWMMEDTPFIDRIALNGNVLEFSSAEYGQWCLPIREIAVIGEYTNSDGPVLPDHFWVLVERSRNWRLIPTEGRTTLDVLNNLAALLGVTWHYGLLHSTDLASRVVWPPAIADKPLFAFDALSRRGPLARLFSWVPSPVKIRLSDEVNAYISAIQAVPLNSE